jgi:uncharacterized protein
MTTRRDFLKTGAAAFAGLYGINTIPASTQPVASSQAAALSLFAYSDVQLSPSTPLQQQFDSNHSLLMGLSEDRLMKVFRQRVGQPAPGDDMGGWYDTDSFNPGHTFGQHISALSRMYASTGSKDTQAKVHRLVKAYSDTVDPTGKFFYDHRYPAYVYDKLVCGLIDAHEFAQDPVALSALDRTTPGALLHLPEKALTREEMLERPHHDFTFCWDESYTLPENLFLAWQRSGQRNYRDLAARYLQDKDYFDPLSRGENILPGLHAYSHVNALSSAVQAYWELGDAKYLRAAQNAWSMIETTQSYATGGWGPDEAFVKLNRGLLGDSLIDSRKSFETPCGSYGHFKITRYLLRITRDSRYGDSMERVMYNTVLGSKPILTDGSAFYYSDYHAATSKTYNPDKWPCCSGTLPQIAADYRISTYLRGPDGVYVNLFVPSTLTWTQSGSRLSLTQVTGYPASGAVRIDVAASAPAEFTIYLRIPAWAAHGPRLAVNGKAVGAALTPGSFASVARTWQNGDRIELELPMPIRLQPIDDHRPNVVAVLRGPIVLFAISGNPPALTRAELLRAQPLPGTADFAVATSAGTLRLRPFVDIQDEVYTTYLAVRG